MFVLKDCTPLSFSLHDEQQQLCVSFGHRIQKVSADCRTLNNTLFSWHLRPIRLQLIEIFSTEKAAVQHADSTLRSYRLEALELLWPL